MRTIRRWLCWWNGTHSWAIHPVLPALYCDFCGFRSPEPLWFKRELDRMGAKR